jgi:hypothetical protein
MKLGAGGLIAKLQLNMLYVAIVSKKSLLRYLFFFSAAVFLITKWYHALHTLIFKLLTTTADCTKGKGGKTSRETEE